MNNTRNRPEHELLLLITRRKLAPAQQSWLRDLLSDVRDWDYLLTAANHHGLIPLLQAHLHSINADLVPTTVRSRLKQQSLSQTQNVLHLVAKQLKLYRQLKQNNVRAAIFKGPVLSQMAYGELSLRQSGDIDVLISRADFDRTRQVLESLGYQMTPALTHAQLTSHLRSHCEIQFVRDDWFTVVDLHWALAPKNFVFKLETDEVLARLQRVEVAGVEIGTLGTEDLILYLSMHGAKHLWRAIEWISSLGELIRSGESIAWETVVERAEKAHATRMLGLGLRLVEAVSAVEIPRKVLEATDRDAGMRKMAEQILSQVFAIAGPADSTETNLYNLRVMDRKRDALVSALRAIFVPTFTDWSSLHLPPSLHPLYYAYRPLRLSRIYSTSLLQKLTSKGAACL